MSPTVLRQGSFEFFFYSREMNEPPHVHVRRGGSAARFWLDPIGLERVYQFSPSDQRRIREIVAEHQHELLEAWDEHFGQGPPRHQR